LSITILLSSWLSITSNVFDEGGKTKKAGFKCVPKLLTPLNRFFLLAQILPIPFWYMLRMQFHIDTRFDIGAFEVIVPKVLIIVFLISERTVSLNAVRMYFL
jgi:hypothetical protein